MSNISVNTPTSDDKDAWESLYRSYAEFYNMPMAQETLDIVWSWIHDEHNAFFCLIAKNENNQALGLMHFRAMPSPLRGAEVGFLDDLFVLPEARGSDTVKALYAALDKAASEKGWPFIRWITADNNYRARNLYDKISDKTAWVTYQFPLSE